MIGRISEKEWECERVYEKEKGEGRGPRKTFFLYYMYLSNFLLAFVINRDLPLVGYHSRSCNVMTMGQINCSCTTALTKMVPSIFAMIVLEQNESNTNCEHNFANFVICTQCSNYIIVHAIHIIRMQQIL